jgi:TolA-binding protein
MSDPGRLFEQTDSELERLLLGVGRSEKSSARARARTLAALGVAAGSSGLAVTAATAAASAGPASASFLGKITWAKIALGLSALGAVAAGPPVYRAWQRYNVHAPAASPAAVVAAAPIAAAGAPEASPAVNAPATLTRELGALDAIRAALARGQAPRALEMLDAYARRYPEGRLALEAEILRIDALARDGRADSARARAAAFLERHPKSVLAARARQYLGE